MNVGLILLGMLILLLVKGFFSGSEIALVNSDKIKLRHKARLGNRGAKAVLTMFETPDVLLGTTLVGTNIATVALTTLGTLLMIHFFGDMGDLYALLIYSPLFLIFGEIVPKSIYQQKANTVAPRVVQPLKLFSWVFYPLVFVFSRIARLIARMVGVQKSESSLFMTREQMRSIVEMAEMGSNVDIFDRDRIKRAIRFTDTTVGQAMTPVADMVAIDKNTSTINALRLTRTLKFADVPVYEENISNIIGVLALSPWDAMNEDIKAKSLIDLMKPALYVAENQALDELFSVFSEEGMNTAIVVDEFGSTVGLITRHDLFEEVVGDLGADPEATSRARFRERMLWQQQSEGVYLMDARLSMAEVNEILNTNLPATGYFSLAGFMLAYLRHIPSLNESVVESGYRFTVETMTRRSIRTVRVERVS